jgi:putative glutamine amidotransferase
VRPRIGITCDYERLRDSRGSESGRYFCAEEYVSAVDAAGGQPVLLSYAGAVDVDGLVITGGAFDIPPEHYGQAPAPELGPQKPARSQFEAELIRHALATRTPLLGVCGGMQLLNVVCGGTLHQHIEGHEQVGPTTEASHKVTLQHVLAALYAEQPLEVNSTHHQAVNRLGRDLRISAVAPDGIIEGIEHTACFAIGVQWHPERLANGLSVYRALVAAAREK